MPAKGHRKTSPRRHLVKLYVTADERDALIAEATARAMTRTRFLRGLLAHHQNRPSPALHRLRAAAPLVQQLTRIGNNLNQLTHLAHIGRLQADTSHLGEVLSQLLNTLRIIEDR